MFDLKTIPLPDLKALILFCDALQKHGNSYFEDRFVILSRVALAHHQIKEMAEYPTEDLLEAVEFLKIAIDDATAALPNDYAAKLYFRGPNGGRRRARTARAAGNGALILAMRFED